MYGLGWRLTVLALWGGCPVLRVRFIRRHWSCTDDLSVRRTRGLVKKRMRTAIDYALFLHLGWSLTVKKE